LDAASLRDARPHVRAPLGRPRQNEVCGRDGGYLDLKVDAVEHRPRDARLIALGASPSLAADITGFACAAQRQGFIAAMSWMRDG
jgi:hypothetical protein